MTTQHTVEVTLCTDCLFDVGNQCEMRWCNTWQALMAIARRQTLRNMAATAKHVETWRRQQSLRVGVEK